MPDLDSLNPDQRLALKSAATNLREHFAGTFSQETIERFLETSYDQFAERAKFTHFLPLMAERFARQRLTALARVEGKAGDGVPIVLFLCVHNAGRSQMALGWFNRLAGGRAIGWSGGSEPTSEINHPFAMLRRHAPDAGRSGPASGYASLLRELATILAANALDLARLLERPPTSEDELHLVRERDRLGARIHRQLGAKIATSYMVPFHREDLHALTEGLTDVIDDLRHGAELLVVRQPSSPISWSLMREFSPTPLTKPGNSSLSFPPGGSDRRSLTSTASNETATPSSAKPWVGCTAALTTTSM